MMAEFSMTLSTYPLRKPFELFPVLYAENDFKRAVCESSFFEFLMYELVKIKPPYLMFSHGSKILLSVRWIFCAFLRLICVSPKSKLWPLLTRIYEALMASSLFLKSKTFLRELSLMMNGCPLLSVLITASIVDGETCGAHSFTNVTRSIIEKPQKIQSHSKTKIRNKSNFISGDIL